LSGPTTRLGTSRLRRRTIAFDNAESLLAAPAYVLEHPAGHEDFALMKKKAGFELELSSGVALCRQYCLLGRDAKSFPAQDIRADLRVGKLPCR
jgi:hypothetical protein